MVNLNKSKIFFWLEFYGKKWQIDLDYFLRNGWWVMLRQFIEIVIGLALFVILARMATEETLGHFQFILSIFAVVSFLSIPGLNVSVLRSISRGYDGEYVFSVKKSFIWSLIGIPLILFIGFYYYVYINHTLGIALIASSLFFPFFYAPNTWNQLLQGKNKYKKLSIFGIIQCFINAAVTITVIYFSSSNLLYIILAYLLSFSALNVIYYYKSIYLLENSKVSGDTVAYGWFLTKINLLNYAAESIDKIIIGVLMSPISLAVFTVISMIPFKLKMVIKSITSVFFPKMSKENFRAIDFLKEKKAFIVLGIVFIFTLVLSAIFFFAIEPVSKSFFGNKYAEYYHYGRQFSILIVIYPPLLVTGFYIQAKKMSKSMLYLNIISLSVKIITLIIAIKIWGIIGAIWAYNLNMLLLLVMQFFAILLKDYKLSRIRQLQPEKTLIKY